MPVSKMMEEVWRWKDEVYRKTKDMTDEEVIAYFRGAVRRIEEQTGIKLNLPRAGRRKPAVPRRKPPT